MVSKCDLNFLFDVQEPKEVRMHCEYASMQQTQVLQRRVCKIKVRLSNKIKIKIHKHTQEMQRKNCAMGKCGIQRK